jgi:outer membrane protein TolC
LSFAQADSFIGSAGGAISLPLFHGGRLRGQYRAAEVDYDLAVASYDGAVAQALQEVADAVASRRALDARLMHSRASHEASRRAWTVADNRYRGGLSSYLEVLDAQDAMIAARRSVANLKARALALDVALVRALGGGFGV